jgi:hypothetical protein
MIQNAAQQIAKKQKADLRDVYLHNLSDFCSYHLVYVYELGCDKWVGFQETGWSPLGVTPIPVLLGAAISDFAYLCPRWRGPVIGLPGINRYYSF